MYTRTCVQAGESKDAYILFYKRRDGSGKSGDTSAAEDTQEHQQEVVEDAVKDAVDDDLDLD